MTTDETVRTTAPGEEEDEQMTEKKTYTLGESIKATKVTRPDGSEHTVTGGLYVLDVAGIFVVDDVELTVK